MKYLFFYILRALTKADVISSLDCIEAKYMLMELIASIDKIYLKMNLYFSHDAIYYLIVNIL